MSRRLPTTPRSRVRNALRQLWLRSRERAARLKADRYTCERCGRKQSKAKGKEVAVLVHHLHGVEWEAMVDHVYRHLLCDPVDLMTLCVDCHDEVHMKEEETQ